MTSRCHHLLGYGESSGEDEVVINFQDEAVFARLLKLQVLDVIDQMNAVQRALRLEFAFKLHDGRLSRRTEAGFERMFANPDIRQDDEPEHLGVYDGKLPGTDSGEQPHQVILAGGGIHVDGIAAGEGQQNRFGEGRHGEDTIMVDQAGEVSFMVSNGFHGQLLRGA